MENALYRIRLYNVTAGVEVSPDGVVVNAAPVFEKFIGVRANEMRKWVFKKGGNMIEINRQGRPRTVSPERS